MPSAAQEHLCRNSEMTRSACIRANPRLISSVFGQHEHGFIMRNRMRKLTYAFCAALVLTTLWSHAIEQPPRDDAFSLAVADQLISQFRNGLLAGNQRRALAA